MPNLLIVESPAKAGTIKKYLGRDFDIVASMGHVRDLPKSTLGVDITHDFAPRYVVMPGRSELIDELKSKAKKYDKIYLATDPDREGEAISWHLAYLLGLDPAEKNRVTFNEISKKAVLEGVAHPTGINMDMVDAQQARRVLDRLVGYKISPFLWRKVKKGLSAGRVQSVVVRLLCDREKEIESFTPEEYWTLDAVFRGIGAGTFNAHFFGDEKGKIELKSAEQTEEISAALDGAEYVVTDVVSKKKNVRPAPPYITSTLQREASRRLNFQPQVTMRTAQQLYEGIDIEGYGSTGLITYMRTDSLRISDDAVTAARDYITGRFGARYCPATPNRYTKSKAAQDAHEAIRPTDITLVPDQIKDSLSAQQYKLYKLIWSRFVASQMANEVLDVSAVTIGAGKYIFKLQHSKVNFDGFTALYSESKDDDEETDRRIPPLAVGDVLKFLKLEPAQHYTQPPARYTDDTLIKVMEDKGIGRPSTYAPTIATVIDREYALREKKSLIPTPLGRTVNDLMCEYFKDIVNVKFTASMETRLEEIAQGGVDWIEVIRGFYGGFESTLTEADEKLKGVKIKVPEEVTDVICEKCGRNMVIRSGRNGKFLACPGFPECRNTKSIIVETPGACPVCGKRVLEKKSRKGKVYFGCEDNPQCPFMTWDKPLAEKCPKCGKSLFRENRRGGKIHCLDENCGFEKTAPRAEKKENADES